LQSLAQFPPSQRKSHTPRLLSKDKTLLILTWNVKSANQTSFNWIYTTLKINSNARRQKNPAASLFFTAHLGHFNLKWISNSQTEYVNAPASAASTHSVKGFAGGPNPSGVEQGEERSVFFAGVMSDEPFRRITSQGRFFSILKRNFSSSRDHARGTWWSKDALRRDALESRELSTLNRSEAA
jgi:hypothetical protein